MIMLLTICVKREIREWQFSSFFIILSEKLVNISVKAREIIRITWFRHDLEFTT